MTSPHPVDLIPLASFAAVLAVGAVSAWPAVQMPAEGAVLDGSWQAALERTLDEEVVLQDVGSVAWGVADWVLFREGRPGVIVGTDGWLFTDEEFETADDEAATVAAWVARITDVHDRLRARGAHLLVAPLPSKVRMVPGHRGRATWPAAAAARYDRLLDALSAAELDAVDLRPALDDDDAWLRTDTHWTPAGARAAADAIADHLDAADRPRTPATVFTAAPGTPTPHEGDLLRYVPLGPWAHLGPSPDTLTPWTAEAPPADAAALFGDPEIPVALVGTSYADDPRWGFRDALRVSLAADVLDAADEGGGPWPPMADLLSRDEVERLGVDVVVWEIPERYLAHPPKEDP